MKSWLRILVVVVCLSLALSACLPAGTPTGREPNPIFTSAPTSATDGVLTVTRPIPRFTQTPSPTARPSPIPPPTAAPWGGWLVFSSRRQDTNGDGVIDRQDAAHIYTMDLGAKATTQVTFGNYTDSSPCWSPDRNRIAFVSTRGGKENFDLFVIATDGSGLVQLTDTPEHETGPVWSPDGAQIAYITATPAEWGSEERRLHILSVVDHTSRQLTHGPGNDAHPDWSPDGRFLAFDRKEPEGGGSAVYFWVAATGSFIRLELPDESFPAVVYYYPRWLPREGNLLSLVRSEIEGDTVSDYIVIFEVEERAGEIVLHQTPAAIETNFAPYTWGPGGEWLIAPVHIRAAGPQVYNLLRVRVSLTKKSRACWECTDLLDAEFLTEGEYYDIYADWAP